jgi:Uma2 family endonuclease
MEVISPRTESSSGTERTDRKEKFGEYAQAGVAEYWLVDAGVPQIEVYVLHEGKYRLLSRWGQGVVARSQLLEGFEVPVSAIVEEGDAAV